MKKVIKAARITLVFLGMLFSIMIILAFTTVPFRVWYHLSMKSAGIHRPPEFIVVMGGGGMPSHSGLIRCWYAAQAAKHFNRSKVIIALPGDTSDPKSSVNAMRAEMILRGISPDRIMIEDSGTNTRSEAINIYKIISRFHNFTVSPSLLLVTTPEHVHRSVLAFRKAGFTRVDGLPAFERALESDVLFDGRKLGGRYFLFDVGNHLSLRYEFWTQVTHELSALREYLALAYYKLQGWI